MFKKTYLLRILIIITVFCSFTTRCLATEEEDLAFAVGAYNDGFYDMAEQGFASFVKKYRYSKKRPYALYLLGTSRFVQKNYEGSKEAFKELTQLYPKYERIALAHYYLGESGYITDDYKTARSSYQHVYENTPEDVSRETVLFRLGELDFMAGDYEGAKSVLSELRELNSDYEYTDMIRLYLAFSYYYTKDYAKAFSEFNYVLTKEDLIKDVQKDVLYYIADSAFILRKYDSASKYFARFLKKEERGNRAEAARYFLAISYYKSNNKEGALKELREYYKKNPRGRYISDVIEQLADIYFEVKNYTNAIKYYTKIIELQDKSKKRTDWLLKTAWCYTKLNEYKKASEVYDRLEKEAGRKGVSDDISYLRAEAYFMSKEYSKAINIYEKLKEVKKYRKNVLTRLGDSYFYLEDYEMAKRYYFKFLMDYSGQETDDTLLKLAISLQHELPPEKHGEAVKYYEKIIARNKGGYHLKTALYNAIVYYDKVNDTKKLKKALQKYVDIKNAKIPPYFYLRLAEAYFNDGKRKKAIKYYDLARKTNSADVMAESLFKLAELYHKENDLKKSIEYFNLAENAFSKDRNVKEVSLIYLERGSIYEKQKKLSVAKGEYSKVLEISDDEDLRKVASERINAIDNKLGEKKDGAGAGTKN